MTAADSMQRSCGDLYHVLAVGAFNLAKLSEKRAGATASDVRGRELRTSVA
jgi:hypothetical protein